MNIVAQYLNCIISPFKLLFQKCPILQLKSY